jgi:hypothetical protein
MGPEQAPICVVIGAAAERQVNLEPLLDTSPSCLIGSQY